MRQSPPRSAGEAGNVTEPYGSYEQVQCQTRVAQAAAFPPILDAGWRRGAPAVGNMPLARLK